MANTPTPELTANCIETLKTIQDFDNLLIDDYCRTLADIIVDCVREIDLSTPTDKNLKLQRKALQVAQIMESLGKLRA